MDFKPDPMLAGRAAAGIASTDFDAIAALDVEVELYAALFLDAQGKLPSIEEILAGAKKR